jgi:Lon protease-like protein
MPTPNQKLLIRNLYRNLHRWSRVTPQDVSLAHLDHWVGGRLIDNPNTLQQSIRQVFRDDNGDTKQRIQKAMEGIKILNTLRVDDLPTSSTTTTQQALPTSSTTTTRHTSSTQNSLNSVQWLPPMSEMQDSPFLPSYIPLFPLSGPLLPQSDNTNILPLFSMLSELPMAGMEIPLNIFEPRYIKMYQDMLKRGSKKFVVPFAHPHQSGQFAKFGWLYEIVQVEDVADQTNGQISLLCNHLVTKPVRIDSVVNPSDWSTQLTYLQVEGEILEEKFVEAEDLKEIEVLLRSLNAAEHRPNLIRNLLTSLGEANIWSLVHIWISALQMQVTELQVQIVATIQEQAKSGEVNDIIIQAAQEPHRQELESLLMEIGTLVPLLLQESPKERCQRMLERFQERLEKK